jgi:hypothetical protein
MSKSWDRTSSLVAFGLALVTVSVYAGSVTDPVNVTKLFVLGGFAFAAAGSIIGKKLFSHFSDRKFGFVACLAFFVASLGVLLASKAPFAQSYYGAYGRNNGFLLYLLLILIFIASLAIGDNQKFKKYLWAMWFAGLVNVLYALWVLGFGAPCWGLVSLPTLSPSPSLAQRAREGSRSPHLVIELGLGFYWRSACWFACVIQKLRRPRDGFGVWALRQ